MHDRSAQRSYLVLAIMLCVLIGLTSVWTLLPTAQVYANPPEADSLAQEIVVLTNAERANQGLPPLKLNQNLKSASMWITQDQADKNYFSHTDSLGRGIGQRLPDFGYTGYRTIGENLHAGSSTPAQAIAAWMNSSGHRANLLSSSFCEMGAGYGYNPNSTYQRYWSQDFGCRFDVFPLVINSEAAETSSELVALYIYGADWAQQMRLSNNQLTWTAWLPYQSKLDWTLASGNGERSVYVELRNGSTIRSASDTIFLTTLSPSPTATTTMSPSPTTTSVLPEPSAAASPTTAVALSITAVATPLPTRVFTDPQKLFLPVIALPQAEPSATATPTARIATPTATVAPATPVGGYLPTTWLERVNAYRARAGVPLVTADPILNTNCFEHARYMAENNDLTHHQNASLPWASAAGERCAEHSNAWMGTGMNWQPYHPIDGWMDSVGHRLWLLYPTTPVVGFGFYANSTTSAASIDVLSRARFDTDAQYQGWPVRYPAAGQTNIPSTRYPITLQWPYFGETPLVSSTSLRTQAGQTLEHTATTALPVGHKGIAIEPNADLPPNTVLVVTVEGSYAGKPFTLSWNFSTGP